MRSYIGKPVTVLVPETSRVVSRQVVHNAPIPEVGGGSSVTVNEFLDTNGDGRADIERSTTADTEGGSPWSGPDFQFLDNRQGWFKDGNSDGLIDEFATGVYEDGSARLEIWKDRNGDGKTDSYAIRDASASPYPYVSYTDTDFDGAYDLRYGATSDNRHWEEIEITIPVSELD